MTEKKKTTKKKEAAEAPKKRAPRVKKVEVVAAEQVEQKKPVAKKASKKHVLPKIEKFEGTGRRKTATARVYLYKGTGNITVNSKPFKEYFVNRAISIAIVLRPLKEINVLGQYDITANVLGGGVPSQADAIRMGIARALVAADPKNRIILRSLDLLMRDPRVKERKKYGLKRARRAFQYSKR